MKPAEQVKRELTQQWLTKAEQDFQVAQHLVSQGTGYFGAVGFRSQHAAEKYVKALLTHHQIEFPKTHNLGELLDLLVSVQARMAGSLREITALNPYGVEMRYPGDVVEVSSEEADKAVKLAAKVRNAILAALPHDLKNS